MMPGMNPKQMEQAMRAMGMKQTQLNATQVVIKLEGKELVINNPQVIQIDMRGIKTYQVMGDAVEREEGATKEDVQMVMEQANVDESTAKAALEKANGDIAQAIIDLSQED